MLLKINTKCYFNQTDGRISLFAVPVENSGEIFRYAQGVAMHRNFQTNYFSPFQHKPIEFNAHCTYMFVVNVFQHFSLDFFTFLPDIIDFSFAVTVKHVVLLARRRVES